jgi:glucose/arabinose dehydrogenase
MMRSCCRYSGGPLIGYSVHNGGAMLFGNDGKLYVTHGDGGNQDNAQDLSIVLGSIMRLNDDGSTPDDNPFTTTNGYDAYNCRESEGMVPENSSSAAVCSEIYSYGLRNPFRMALDPNEKEKVRFSIQDVGAKTWEELSYGGTDYAGMDYGWKPYEGAL